MRQVCSECYKHPALARVNIGRFKGTRKVKGHDLCKRCFVAGNNSRRYETTKSNQESFREEAERIIWEKFLWPQLQ